MKTLTAMTLGLIISTVALPALATKAQREQLSECKTELRAIYGERTHLKLKSISKRGSMRIRTVPVGGDRILVSCSRDSAGNILLADSEGVALVHPKNDSVNQVSANR